MEKSEVLPPGRDAFSAPSRSLSVLLLGLGLLFCGMTSFPLGAALLREFGSNIVNFVLLGALVLTASRASGAALPRGLLMVSCLLILACGVSIAVPLFDPPLSTSWRDPVQSWLLQFLMAIWFVAGIAAWKGLLEDRQVFGEGYALFVRTLMLAALILDGFYVLDLARVYFHLEIVPRGVIDMIAQTDAVPGSLVRPAGLNSEPSHFGIWAAVTWPLLFCLDRKKLTRADRLLATGLVAVTILAGFSSLARTFYVIFAVQAAVLLALRFSLRSLFFSRRGIILLLVMAALTGLFMTFALERILSVFDLATNGSSIARWDYTLASVYMGLHHPLVGVGLGNFTAQFYDYSQAFGFSSGEVLRNLNNMNSQRITAANMLVRIFAETGWPGLVPVMLVVFYPVAGLLKSPKGPLRTAAILCWAAAALSWLSTDQMAEPASLFGWTLSLYQSGRTSGAAGRQLALRGLFMAAFGGIPRSFKACIAAALLVSTVSLAAAAVWAKPATYEASILLAAGPADSSGADRRLRAVGISDPTTRAIALMQSAPMILVLSRAPDIRPVLCGRIVDRGDCTDDERLVEALRAHFRVWTIFNSPLIRVTALAGDPAAATVLARRIVRLVNERLLYIHVAELSGAQDALQQLIARDSRNADLLGDFLQDVIVAQGTLDKNTASLVQLSDPGAVTVHAIWPQPLNLLICVTVMIVVTAGTLALLRVVMAPDGFAGRGGLAAA